MPGPGTYGKGGVPVAAWEEKQKKSASNVGMLSAATPVTREIAAERVKNDFGNGDRISTCCNAQSLIIMIYTTVPAIITINSLLNQLPDRS